MKKFYFAIIFSVLVFAFLLIPQQSNAGCCGCDPVYDHKTVLEVKSAVWVRDEACVATGSVIDTLQAGEVVQVTHITDGWYKVISPRGKVGWSGEQFFKTTDKPLTSTTSSNSSSSSSSSTTSTSETASSLRRLNGYILLQVEDHGEAWYINPTNSKRYYMKDGPTAYEMMRSFGLGITDADLAKLPSVSSMDEMLAKPSICASNPTAARLNGRILLQVEQHGEAWYVYPKNCYRIYMKDGAAAYEIMRYLGLGIANVNLDLITSDSVPLVLGDKIESNNNTELELNTDFNNDTELIINDEFENDNVLTSEQPLINIDDLEFEVDSSDIQVIRLVPVPGQPAEPKFTSSGSLRPGDGSFQKGSVPSGFNYAEINQYVLDRINYERTKRGKPAIISDQRMVDTSSVWAYEMYKQGMMTHTRKPVNMMAREWVWQEFEVHFAKDWGWLYENIGGGSYNRSQGINESIKASMDSLFDFYMSEESYNGIHYQTIMHDQLTHVGVGFYFDGTNDSGQLWTVLHYGSLWGQVPVVDKVW